MPCLTVFPYIGYAVFFYSFTLFIAAVFVCRQVLKENLLEGGRVCTSSDCINTWLAGSCGSPATEGAIRLEVLCKKKKQQMEQKTRRSEAKCTFNNKGAAVCRCPSQRAASFNSNNLRAVNSSRLIGEKFSVILFMSRCSRSCRGSGGFPARPGWPSSSY